MINTIPYKIPEPILENLEKGSYDKVILFTLSTFRSHKLKELVNNPSESIENRMDEALFSQWANQLKGEQCIKEFELDDEIYYRITSKGEDEIMKYLRNFKIADKFYNLINFMENLTDL